MSRLASRITKRWVARNIITSDVYDCYVYGWEIILLTLLEITNILIIGLFTNSLGNAIIFLVTFVLVRRYTGGYHANTSLKCNICLVLIYLLNLYITFNYEADIVILITATLICGIVIIFKIGPIENENKQLSINQKESSKKLSLLLFWGCCAVSFIFTRINTYMATTIIITLIEILALMLITKVKPYIAQKKLCICRGSKF